jgi:hypothetical protein
MPTNLTQRLLTSWSNNPNRAAHSVLAVLGGYTLFSYIVIERKLPYVIACPFKLITGCDCPLCGLSRSLGCLLHLDLKSSLAYNRLTIPIMLFAILFTLYKIKPRSSIGANPDSQRVTLDAGRQGGPEGAVPRQVTGNGS